MTDTSVVTAWSKEITKVAKKAARDWSGIVSAEDLEQEIYLHILERPGTMRDLAAMDETSRYRTLHKIAQRIASQERDDYAVFSGNFRYSVDEVRGLLESIGDPEADPLGSSWKADDYTKPGRDHSDPTADAALANVELSEARSRMADALNELERENPGQHEALIQRFVYGVVPNPSNYAGFMKLSRAVESLTNRMNHAHKRSFTKDKFFTVKSRSGSTVRYLDNPGVGESLGGGVGTREVMSNEKARWKSKNSCDADYTPALARDNHVEPEVWDG